MRTKSEAQVFLESYELDNVKVECKLEERQFWHDLSLTITGQMAGERVQSSGSKDKMAQARDICIDKENEILSQIKELAEKQSEVTGVLDQLTIPAEYRVLHMRFIQGMELEEIADKLRTDYSAITTCQGRGFKSVEAILERVGYGN